MEKPLLKLKTKNSKSSHIFIDFCKKKTNRITSFAGRNSFDETESKKGFLNLRREKSIDIP